MGTACQLTTRQWSALTLLSALCLAAAATYCFFALLPLGATAECLISRAAALEASGGQGAAVAPSVVPTWVMAWFGPLARDLKYVALLPALLTLACLLAVSYAGVYTSRRCVRITTWACNVLMLPSAIFYGAMGLAHFFVDNSFFGTTWQASIWQPVHAACTEQRDTLEWQLGNATDALDAALAADAGTPLMAVATAARDVGAQQLSDFGALCTCLRRLPTEVRDLKDPGMIAVISGLAGSVFVAGVYASTRGRPRGGGVGVLDKGVLPLDEAGDVPGGRLRDGKAATGDGRPSTADRLSAVKERAAERDSRRLSLEPPRQSRRSSHQPAPWGAPTPAVVFHSPVRERASGTSWTPEAGRSKNF